jgi:hypothetical protein
MPEHCRICGEPMAPAERITSARAVAWRVWPPWTNSTPVARLPSNNTRVVCARVSTFRFGRLRAGLRKPLAVLQRRPLWAVC